MDEEAMEAMRLNPVRAGLVENAGDCGFSGFGEACAGGSAARRGIARIESKPSWTTKWHERYRARLCSRMGLGVRPCRGDRRSTAAGATMEKAMPGAGLAEEAGLLSKIRAFSEGWVVGSVAWVESFCAANGWLGFRKGRKAQPVAQDGGADCTEVVAVVKRQ
ncbi:MAG: hypothetical protein JJT96_16670 [Opitutales bacterium]|nr:hypothetical protein [Opitutales bacterium]